MSEDIEIKIEQLLKKLSQEIEKNLLITLSKDKTKWIMDDIEHVIFSHLLNDLVALHNED